MNAPAVLELPLDDALLKVLSSESRREILRLLRERRMTGAELATRLELGKPAVAEHLKKLQEAELIERIDDPERRWVYYNLSARGRGILEPQRVRFYLVMAVAALALMVGVVLALGLVVLMQGTGSAALEAGSGTDGSKLASAGGPSADPGNPSGTDPGAVAAAATTSKAPEGAADPAGTPATPVSTDRVFAGPSRPADPLGGPEAPATPRNRSFTLVLDDFTPVAPTRSNPVPETTILLYRPADVDADGAVRVQVLTLNATELAAANLTQAVLDSASIPGMGVLLSVPEQDRLLLPPADALGTLSVRDVAAAVQPAPPPPVASPAVEPPAATVERSAPSGEAFPEAQPPAAAIPTTPPQPEPEAPASSSGKQPAQGSPATKPADQVGGPPVQQDAVARTQVAPVPLAALAAALLAVSLYIPGRRA